MKEDDFARLKPHVRAAVVKDAVERLFGPKNGATIWKHMEPGYTLTTRQPGDAAEPEKNAWRGAWRIHSLEGPGDP